MLTQLKSWCAIPSGTYNLPGLSAMADALADAFSPLGTVRRIDLPTIHEIGSDGHETSVQLGQLLSITCRPELPRRVLLAIHFDTVYPAGDPFDHVTEQSDGTWIGPGVVDAKGGIAVMLFALGQFERLPIAKHIGWEVILNPDEEIGSPGSASFFIEAARRNTIGLLFEPALPDGMLVGERKGSGNFTIVVRGRSAHAGRDFLAGRSAIVALSRLIATVADRAGKLTLNCGLIDGGSAVNIVPDLAIARFNGRASSDAEAAAVQQLLIDAVAEANQLDGISATLHGGFTSPPKPLTPASESLLNAAQDCGREMGLNLTWRSSGGTCDGNRLAAAGLPLIDTLGPVGGNLHSPREYLLRHTVAERAKLTVGLLARFAEGRIPLTP
ncbi:MAG: hydrolase [Phycisphaerae bacterium]|nr:hydrolase [Phycisphaerae bacterium]